MTPAWSTRRQRGAGLWQAAVGATDPAPLNTDPVMAAGGAGVAPPGDPHAIKGEGEGRGARAVTQKQQRLGGRRRRRRLGWVKDVGGGGGWDEVMMKKGRIDSGMGPPHWICPP
jgi:hypothetical protein